MGLPVSPAFDAGPRPVASWLQAMEQHLERDRAAEGTQRAGSDPACAADLRPDAAAEPQGHAVRDHLRRCLAQEDAQPPVGSISLEAEVPEVLFEGMRAFLQGRPEWDQYRVITSALAGFLFQNGCADRCVAQHYLNGLFMRPGD